MNSVGIVRRPRDVRNAVGMGGGDEDAWVNFSLRHFYFSFCRKMGGAAYVLVKPKTRLGEEYMTRDGFWPARENVWYAFDDERGATTLKIARDYERRAVEWMAAKGRDS